MGGLSGSGGGGRRQPTLASTSSDRLQHVRSFSANGAFVSTSGELRTVSSQAMRKWRTRPAGEDVGVVDEAVDHGPGHR